MPNEACNFAEIFQAERAEIASQCDARSVAADLCLDGKPGSPVEDRLGITFSGGGIRSASVGLGIAQRLARAGILRQAHYLSGISGGGYLVGWLTAWTQRKKSFAYVENCLGNNTEDGNSPRSATPPDFQRFLEPDPLHYLRRYASYLTPRLGLLSGDTLAAIAIYLRNVLLNQTMLAAALVSLTMLLQLLTPTLAWSHRASTPWLKAGLVVALLLFLYGIVQVWQSLTDLAPDPISKQSKTAPTKAIACGAAICILVWLILPDWYANYPTQHLTRLVVSALVFVGFLITAPFSKKSSSAMVEKNKWVRRFIYLLAWTICGVLVCAIDGAFRQWLLSGDKVVFGTGYVVLGLSLLMLALVALSFVFIGILGDALPDSQREWLARFAGYFLLFGVASAALLAIELYGPMLMHLLFSGFRQPSWKKHLLAAFVPGGWLFIVISGLLASNSSNTSGHSGSSSKLERLVIIAPPVFLLGLLLLSSWGTHALTVRIMAYGTSSPRKSVEYLNTAGWRAPSSTTPSLIRMHLQTTTYPVSKSEETRTAQIDSSKNSVSKLSKNDWRHRERTWYFLVWLATTIIAAVLAWRLDVNEFSMHLFYRNRLVRTFLGASNKARKPSYFTGFAADDDIALQDLTLAKSFQGPYPLWGTTLNLTSGEDLAWQQRKGASFIYSPLFCGWDYVNPKEKSAQPEHPATDSDSDALLRKPPANCYGYRSNLAGPGPDDPGYGGRGGKPYIGTAMAASGAAASPNMGYHTRPSVAALLAIFNVRLGWWTGNPRNPTFWKQYAPGIGYLLAELFAHATDKDHYVYLSDGGHFENLGIYELIRRKVRFIICSDADADPSFQFQDLGNAIEHCRADFGVEIHMHTQQDFKLSNEPPFRIAHYAVGEICYPGQQAKGILLYVKSSLTNDEPEDVLGKRASDPAFPHDTTANQFFNESLFESYRALGEHMMDFVLTRFQINDWGKDARETVLQFYSALQEEFHLLQ
ncbi:MAG: hypothetical protein WB439_16645 [Acidobacteriaceae bacterium]